MAGSPEPDQADHLWTIAIARLIFGPAMNIQAPPNLMPDALEAMIGAGINDWGGVSPVTPDHVNPEALKTMGPGTGWGLDFQVWMDAAAAGLRQTYVYGLVSPPCAPSATDTACSQKIIAAFTQKAWRRPKLHHSFAPA